MPNAKFDAKSFNPEAFKYIMDRNNKTKVRISPMKPEGCLMRTSIFGPCVARNISTGLCLNYS